MTSQPAGVEATRQCTIAHMHAERQHQTAQLDRVGAQSTRTAIGARCTPALLVNDRMSHRVSSDTGAQPSQRPVCVPRPTQSRRPSSPRCTGPCEHGRAFSTPKSRPHAKVLLISARPPYLHAQRAAPQQRSTLRTHTLREQPRWSKIEMTGARERKPSNLPGVIGSSWKKASASLGRRRGAATAAAPAVCTTYSKGRVGHGNTGGVSGTDAR